MQKTQKFSFFIILIFLIGLIPLESWAGGKFTAQSPPPPNPNSRAGGGQDGQACKSVGLNGLYSQNGDFFHHRRSTASFTKYNFTKEFIELLIIKDCNSCAAPSNFHLNIRVRKNANSYWIFIQSFPITLESLYYNNYYYWIIEDINIPINQPFCTLEQEIRPQVEYIISDAPNSTIPSSNFEYIFDINAYHTETDIPFQCGCPEIASIGRQKNSTIDSETDIYDIQATPNPFTNELSVKLELYNDTEATVQILNLQGQQVASFKENAKFEAGNNTFNINTSNLPGGVYFIRVQTQTEVKTIKIVKQSI